MKTLIIRLSSLGDIVQCLEAADALKAHSSEVHWLVKKEFSYLTKACPSVTKSIEFDKRVGLLGFIKLCLQLRKENYTHIYDAHSNPRSHIASFILRLPYIGGPKFVRRSKDRLKRFAFFKLGLKRVYNFPFKGAHSFIQPLNQWGIKAQWSCNTLNTNESKVKHSLPDDFIALAPSAAWAMKRWPLGHWQTLIKENQDKHFAILGGPDDTFTEELAQINPDKVINLAGKINWLETVDVIKKSRLLVSADTGTLHIADYLNHNVIALLGPTAFGHPSRPNSIVLEQKLSCAPCTKDGRGKCVQQQYQKCMVEISPQSVSLQINKVLDQ